MHTVEGVTVSDIVDHNDTMGSLVVGRSDGLEALLTSCVPDLKLAYLVVRVNRANLEVHTNGWHEVVLELVICESQEQTRLANT